MKKYIPLLALTAINCKDPANEGLEILVKEATTNSSGIANHYDDQSQEDVPVFIYDSETQEPIEGALVTFADSNRFEAFSVSDPSGTYHENFKCRDHNSGLDLPLFAKSDSLVYWDSIHESNPDDVSALDEWSESIEDGSFDEYQYLGCFTREELEAQADNAMKVLKIGAGLAGGNGAYEFVSKMESIKDQLEQIADILADYGLVDQCGYFDYYVANNWTMSELLVCREEPCEESVDMCTGDELFCDDFNLWNEENWEYELGNVSVSEGYLNLEEFAFVQSYGINLPSNSSNFTMSSSILVNSEGLYEISMGVFSSDSSTQAVFGIIDNEGSCDNINGFDRQYDIGDLSPGNKEIQIVYQDGTIKLLIDGYEKFSEQECLNDINFNKVDLSIGGEGSLRIDYSKID